MMKYLPALSFLLLGSIWGSNFLYMKMATECISPPQVAFFRSIFGFIPVFIYAWMRGSICKDHIKYLHHFIMMSLLSTVFFYYGSAKGLSLLPSGLGGALTGAIPLFSFVLGVAFLPEEKMTRRNSFGALIGFGGLLLLTGFGQEGMSEISGLGIFAITVSSLSVGSSFVYGKKYIAPLKIPSDALVVYQLGLGIIVFACITPLTGVSAILADPHALIGLVICLGVLGTGIAYMIFYYLIDKLGAIRAASVTYLPPVLALIIGFVFAGEKIGINEIVGVGFVFIGVYFISKK